MLWNKPSANKPLVHFVNGRCLHPPFAQGLEQAVFGLGCFWGAERCFWGLPQVHVTAVGYAGGHTADPTYRKVCGGATGHAEVVLVVHRAGDDAYRELLSVFWQAHDPTQGMRSGNDIGEQYRSIILCASARQYELANRARGVYQAALDDAGYGKITTGIAMLNKFYHAEDEHQQYLARHPHGYCGIRGLGVPFAADALASEAGAQEVVHV